METKTKLSKGSTAILVGVNFEHQFENGGPKIIGHGSIVVCENKNGGWDIDSVEIMDINEIHIMGIAITGNAEQRAAYDYFRSMGISLYDEAGKVLEEIVNCSGTVEQFVFEQTGIKL